jgi:tetratricopeptide (TPR) repeat protein
MWRYINWLILVGFGAISTVILGFWPLVWALGIGTAAIIIMGILFKDGNWKTAVAIILLAVIGYSTHAFIPIRSAHDPSIDENDPDRSFAAVVGYLERKQYGTQSMTERMFTRRAEWANQFGDYRRMGFWRFFKQQYGFAGPRFFVVLILGLFGMWEAIRRKPDIGLPFWVIVLVCSVGIVLYMNFADGTRQHPVTGADYIEVRDRDYFFTPAFVFFGLAIGLGIAGFIDLIRDTVSDFSAGFRRAAFGASTCLALLPVVPLSVNYFYNDRSNNYMPYDYAENYLKSCRENAIFITNGDNDTFPVWCIQEVYGVRKDVKVVNLSLGNTDWYIRQVRDKIGIPLNLANEEILKMRPYKDSEGGVHRIQDQLVDHIIRSNRWKYPIHFAVTVPEENRRFGGKSMEDHTTIEGMVYHLKPEKKEHEINFERTRELYEREFNYRGVDDPDIYKDETAIRLTNNYAQGFLLLADTLRKAGDYEGALDFLRVGLKILPNSFDIYGYATQLLAQAGRMDTMKTLIENSPVEEKEKLYFNWGIAARAAGRTDDAIEALELTHQLYPDYVDAFRALATTYYESRELLRQIERIEPSQDTLEGTN